jgi:hypothetical protein
MMHPAVYGLISFDGKVLLPQTKISLALFSNPTFSVSRITVFPVDGTASTIPA